MAAIYKCIVTTHNESKIVEATTPAALGAAIGQAIEADVRDDVILMYEFHGPLSRRAQEETV